MQKHIDQKKNWEEYCAREIQCVRPLLERHGITLEHTQPHISGERYLMQAVTTKGGKKLILLGNHTSGKKVVIKASSEKNGKRELLHERTSREILKKMNFAGEVFHTPPEVLCVRTQKYFIVVTEFIDQALPFIERPLPEQFTFALSAFKAQESAHATTSKHRALIVGAFDIRNATSYLTHFASFTDNIIKQMNDDVALATLLHDAMSVLTAQKDTIEQYTGFLTHTDFVPHNIRIRDGVMYLLDHSSLTFGNKYEGWARFLNFMVLYNQPLQIALEEYVKNNRAPEEYASLRLMRIYRLGEIIWYYVRTLDKSTDNLLTLNIARIHFWKTILTHVLKDIPVEKSVITEYIHKRDSLRSAEEKQRQKGLH